MRRTVLPLVLAAMLVGAQPADAAPLQLYQGITRGIRWVRGDTLPTSLQLRTVARARAVYLESRPRQLSPDHRGFGETMTRILGSDWGRWSLAGEIYAGPPRGATARWFVMAWRASPTHRSVMLGRWRAFGVSCARNTTRVYCVAIFAR